MARRAKAEVIEIARDTAGGNFDRAVTPADVDAAARMAPPTGLNDSPLHAALDAIEARMFAVPTMTDRAAINALAESVAELARLMR